MLNLDHSIVEKYKKAGVIGKKALGVGESLAEPGALMLDVAEGIENFIIGEGARLAFPVNLSINNNAAHYSPSVGDRTKLQRGDVLKIDVGAEIDGYLSDNALTVEVGETGEHSDLIDATREALNAAIKKVRPMIPINQIGAEIGRVITERGFRPVRNLGGHGIDRFDLHSRLFIPNYDDGNGQLLGTNMAIAIEPFASTGIGMIHNGPGGNIYILDGTKIRKDEILYKNFNTVPFSQRAVSKVIPDYPKYIDAMKKNRELSEFPVLREHKGVFISQAEHTLLILPDEVIVTTA